MSYDAFDDETPAGYRDADIEMAQLTAMGNHAAKLRKRGICTHGWMQGPNAARGVKVLTCLDCGKEFPGGDAEHQAERDRLFGR